MLGEISIDRGLQVSDRAEHAAVDALPGHFGEEILDGIEPGGPGRREVECPTRVARQPGQHFRMLVRGAVVEHRVDHLAGGDLALDRVEEANEFEMAMALMQRPMTVPSSTLRAANRVVVPCRL